MAVDTFLKIAQKCRRKFAQPQPGENALFVDELTTMLPGIIADLEAHQVRGRSGWRASRYINRNPLFAIPFDEK